MGYRNISGKDESGLGHDFFPLHRSTQGTGLPGITPPGSRRRTTLQYVRRVLCSEAVEKYSGMMEEGTKNETVSLKKGEFKNKENMRSVGS